MEIGVLIREKSFRKLKSKKRLFLANFANDIEGGSGQDRAQYRKHETQQRLPTIISTTKDEGGLREKYNAHFLPCSILTK